MNNKKWLVIGGAAVGILSVLLVQLGNPANMGFCIACFIRDIAGALGLHRAPVVQYLRPEIIGLVLGSFALAFYNRDFNPKGGSSPVIRFVLGFGVMIGALIFLGCPLRLALRLAGGDFNSVAGIFGFIAGIGVGVSFLKKGFSLGRSYRQKNAEGGAMVAVNFLLPFLFLVPALLLFSSKGPGSMHAPVLASLAAGAAVGAFAQRTRLCMAGGIRDVMLFRDWTLLSGFLAIIAAAFVGNMIFGSFKPGFAGQPVAHTEALWNFLGLTAVGFGSVLLGGCPMRQLILTGEGNTDSAMAVIGMLVGAAFCHNFGLASSPAGTTVAGRIACIFTLVVMYIIAVSFTKQKD